MNFKNLDFKKIKSELISIVLLVLVILAFKSVFFMNYTVPTGSMKTTIEPGDKLLVNKMAYNLRIPFTSISLFEFGTPKRGEVIVFDCPYEPETSFVKRVIGLPGDRLEIVQGLITVNGEPLDISIKDREILKNTLIHGGFYQESLGERTYTVRRVPGIAYPPIKTIVPADQYFVMGDNRDESVDSRQWGFVPKKNIKGLAKFIYFSYEWPTTFRWERIGTKF